MKLQETIEQRKSVRSYQNISLNEEDRNFVEELINNFSQDSIFNVPVKIHFLEAENENEKLGTYGVIKGTKQFLGLSVKDVDFGMASAGYNFERTVLELTQRGIGTCWLAGTFNRNQFTNVMELEDDEVFPIVCPIGYPMERQSFINGVFRTISKSDQRKPWDEIFFMNDFNHPLDRNTTGDYAFCLDMLRLAPSAANKQPWRIVYKDDAFHFYRVSGANAYPYDLQELDVGICACHFDLATKEKELPGYFTRLKHIDIDCPDNTKYLFSWIK